MINMGLPCLSFYDRSKMVHEKYFDFVFLHQFFSLVKLISTNTEASMPWSIGKWRHVLSTYVWDDYAVNTNMSTPFNCLTYLPFYLSMISPLLLIIKGGVLLYKVWFHFVPLLRHRLLFRIVVEFCKHLNFDFDFILRETLGFWYIQNIFS